MFAVHARNIKMLQLKFTPESITTLSNYCPNLNQVTGATAHLLTHSSTRMKIQTSLERPRSTSLTMYGSGSMQLSGTTQEFPFLHPTMVRLAKMVMESEIVLFLKTMRRINSGLLEVVDCDPIGLQVCGEEYALEGVRVRVTAPRADAEAVPHPVRGYHRPRALRQAPAHLLRARALIRVRHRLGWSLRYLPVYRKPGALSSQRTWRFIPMALFGQIFSPEFQARILSRWLSVYKNSILLLIGPESTAHPLVPLYNTLVLTSEFRGKQN
jgi:hypothetical protein